MSSPDPSLTIVRQALSPATVPDQRIAISADRWQLAKTRWRAQAVDGRDFGFELAAPLRHGDVVFADDSRAYVIDQKTEPVLVVHAHGHDSASLGWAVGNLHQPLQVSGHDLVVPDDPALRQLFNQQNIPFREDVRRFEPLRAVIGHHHHHGHSH